MTELKGSITASCGHVLGDNENSILVIHGGEDCDAVDGFKPCLFYSSLCHKCEREWRERGWLFASKEEAHAWLDAQRASGQSTP